MGDEDIPTPCIEVDTDENVNLVYELKEAAVEAFLKDNGDSYIMEEMILAANFLMP